MKRYMLLLLLVIATAGYMQAQEFKGLDVSPMDMIEFPTSNSETNKHARVLYGRPQLKGRDVTTLVPEGKVWRMGANEATELTLYTPMKIGDTSLNAGSYTLYAIPSEGLMTVIVNKATHVWGAYNYNADLDVARVTVPVMESSESIEAFSMAFEATSNGFNLHMGWGNYLVAVPFSK